MVTFAMKQQLFLLATCATAVVVAEYHETIGIPTATSIRKQEKSFICSARITQGTLSIARLHPFFGGLIILLESNSTSVCGSTLLTSTKLVTAAHCWDDGVQHATQLIVVLGSVHLFSGGTRIFTDKVVMHEAYNPFTIENDIAIITVPPVKFSDYIKPIRLPKGALLSSTYEGRRASVVGYGITNDTNGIEVTQSLRYAVVTVRGDECDVFGKYFRSSMICTDTTSGGPCPGDSGGPLFVYGRSFSQKYIIGLVSYGSPVGCTVGHPTVYTRIGSYIDWIRSNFCN